MSDTGEQVAMIEEVGVGARDIGIPHLYFTVSGDGWGALQMFDLRDSEGQGMKLLAQVSDAYQLNGRMCVVESEGPGGVVRFVKLLRPARSQRA